MIAVERASEEKSTPPTAPKYYTKWHVFFAAFLGGPIGGGWLLSNNYRVRGQNREAWLCISLSIIALPLLIFFLVKYSGINHLSWIIPAIVVSFHFQKDGGEIKANTFLKKFLIVFYMLVGLFAIIYFKPLVFMALVGFFYQLLATQTLYFQHNPSPGITDSKGQLLKFKSAWSVLAITVCSFIISFTLMSFTLAALVENGIIQTPKSAVAYQQ